MTETCLHSSLAVMSNILNLGVLVVDEKGRLASATPLACELLGYKDSNDVTARWADLRALLALDPRDFPRSGKPVRVTRTVNSQAGGRMLRFELHPLAGKTCPGLLVLIRDKQALDAIDINLLAASRMQTQAYLYGALSHDTKIPLNAMQITLELLADTLADAPEEARDERAARCERHVAALRDEFARLRSALDTSAGLSKPPSEMRRQSFDLRDLVQEVTKLLRSQARRQDVVIEAQVPAGAVTMLGPQDWIKQALLNIAVNGLEAMSGEGRLSIAVDKEEHSATVVISADVAEMAEEVLDGAYQVRFMPSAGDGAFGLNVARAVVESLGGDFLIERDAGTRFRLTLPLG